MAIDLAAMMPPEVFRARTEGLVHEFREAPKAKGAERLKLPVRWRGSGATRL
jgi:LDH2 family malate/lactate/ureidoglycolate dehydrogenase